MNNNINKKEAGASKPSGGFNLIDLIILLLVAVTVCGVIAVYNPDFSLSKIFPSLKKTSSANIRYVLQISEVTPGFASSINDGDTVTTDKGYNIGNVFGGVEIDSVTVIGYDPVTGDVTKTAHPSLSNIIVTVSVTADSDPVTGYSVNGQRIAVGADYEIVLPGFEGKATCISISDEGGTF